MPYPQVHESPSYTHSLTCNPEGSFINSWHNSRSTPYLTVPGLRKPQPLPHFCNPLFSFAELELSCVHACVELIYCAGGSRQKALTNSEGKGLFSVVLPNPPPTYTPLRFHPFRPTFPPGPRPLRLLLPPSNPRPEDPHCRACRASLALCCGPQKLCCLLSRAKAFPTLSAHPVKNTHLSLIHQMLAGQPLCTRPWCAQALNSVTATFTSLLGKMPGNITISVLSVATGYHLCLHRPLCRPLSPLQDISPHTVSSSPSTSIVCKPSL